MRDITPDLLELIKNEFNNNYKNNVYIKDLIKVLDSGNATYEQAHKFANEVGKILANSLKNNITANALPNGKMYFNIADRILKDTFSKNYELVSQYSSDVQTILNKNIGLNIKGIKPDLNKSRIDNLIDKMTESDNFYDVAWLLDEPVKNFTQAVVDDTVKTNVEYHHKLGMQPKIIRKEVGNCCDWCKSVVGVYKYPEEVPPDVYKRHRYCRCTVEYLPGDGKKQNAWSKKWTDPHKQEKIEKRKNFNTKKAIN